MDSPYLTVSEVAAHFRVDPQTVRRWCAGGQLEAVRVGKVFRIDRAAVARFASSQAVST